MPFWLKDGRTWGRGGTRVDDEFHSGVNGTVSRGSQTQSWGLRGEIWTGTNMRPLSKCGNGGCGVTFLGQMHGLVMVITWK